MNVFNDVYKRDCQLLLWCVKSHSYKRFITFVRAVSHTGDGYLHLLLPLMVMWIEPQQGVDFFLLVFSAFTIERPLYFILKNTLKRRRPPAVIPYFFSLVNPSDQFSFPSGHTMAAFLLAGLAITYFGSSAYLLYIWACAVGVSRVILGVHFPTDIVAGATLGSLIAFGVAFI